MAKEVLELEVKSNIGEVAKDTKDLTNEASNAAGEFTVMGVSLNGVKKGFASAALAAKGMFSTIKAGLITTGIGALLVALGSLGSYFTQTERGAEKLNVILAASGATFKVLIDRVSTVGEALYNVFNQSFLTTLKQIGNAFKGITTEIKDDVKSTIDLTKRTNELVDAERKLNVETAQKRARIEELKLVAEDVTKSEIKRLVAAETAFRLENELLDKRVANSKEAVNIQKELNRISEIGEEDLDALAEKEIALANIKAESATKLIELNNKINAINAETLANSNDLYDSQILQAENTQAQWDAYANSRIALNTAIGQSFGQLGNLLEQGSSAAKALALTEIGVNTAVGYMQGLNIAQKASLNPALGPAGALAFPLFYAQQVAAVLGAVNSARGVLGATPGGGGGGGSAPAAPSTPAPQMMSGAFDISGGVAPEPVQAFVLTDSMTNSQNQLANIRRRATI